MFNSLVVRKDTIRGTDIPVVLARAVGKRSTFGMLRGPQSCLDQDGDMGRDRDRGMGRDRDRALFSPIRHSRISALLSRVSVREPTCGWLSTWIFPGAEAPGHLF